MFFGGSFFKIKIADILILNASSIWARVYHFVKWRHRKQLLLLHFIEYCLYQLNNKYTKIAVNSTIQFFETYNQKKCLIKV